MNWKTVATKAVLGLVVLFLVAGAGLWGYNYVALQMPINKVLAESAETQIGVKAHFMRYYRFDVIVFNITSAGGEQVAQRALKLFFEFAAKEKGRNVGAVNLALNGRAFLVVPGDTFKTLGEQFGAQPMVELVRILGTTSTLPGGRPVGSVDKRILKHFLGGLMPQGKAVPSPGAAPDAEFDNPSALEGVPAPTGEAPMPGEAEGEGANP
ncbi:MAG: hypothetical protein KJ042_05140 [Deltaproteobacteria bacterium]|nr:hypothetical protein [Deltaproteobacteria bacterium]